MFGGGGNIDLEYEVALPAFNVCRGFQNIDYINVIFNCYIFTTPHSRDGKVPSLWIPRRRTGK